MHVDVATVRVTFRNILAGQIDRTVRQSRDIDRVGACAAIDIHAAAACRNRIIPGPGADADARADGGDDVVAVPRLYGGGKVAERAFGGAGCVDRNRVIPGSGIDMGRQARGDVAIARAGVDHGQPGQRFIPG